MVVFALSMVILVLVVCLFIFIASDKTFSQIVATLRRERQLPSLDTSVLGKMDELLDDRTAVGNARARVVPTVGTVGGFTEFDPHDFAREHHIDGGPVDFTDTSATKVDTDASELGSVAGNLFKIA
jgi:hypothetical protein